MTNFKKQMLAVLASGSVLVSPLSTVFAGTTIVINGNGSDSTNGAVVVQQTSTQVVQSNHADIDNNVKADAETGENDAKDNTGGDVSIDTGNATTDVSVKNSVNVNEAAVDCCAAGGETSVEISGNGTGSENVATLQQQNAVGVFQDNKADVDNHIKADAETGENDAEDNTGGDVEINTGNAKSMVSVATTANVNRATVGGDGAGRHVSLMIAENGSDTYNDIALALQDAIAVRQDNAARVHNDVEADAETGENDAEDNTGGEVSIDTGNATVDVTVDNMVNFNAADVDCGCLSDVMAKIYGNGTESENIATAALASQLEAFQDNGADLDNDVEGDAETGENDAEDNTGEADMASDPSVDTGDADSTVYVENSGNSNSYGDMGEWEMPEMPEVHFGFNISLGWSQLLSLLGL